MAALTNEVLCFVQNFISNLSKQEILSTLCGFYNADEILDAKTKLFGVAEQFRDGDNSDGMPRLINRKQPDEKRRLDAQDIYTLYQFLDGKKCQLPTFTAANLRRIPPFNPSDSDVCTLATSLCSLRAEVASLANIKNELADLKCLREEMSVIAELKESVSELKSTIEKPAVAPADHQMVLSSTLAPESDMLRGSNSSGTMHLDCNSQTTAPDVNEQFDWVTVTSRHKPALPKPAITRRVPPPVRVKGSRCDGSLKSVPRRQILAAYVGRLHRDTTEGELGAYLAAEGIKGVACRKLVAKNGKKFNTAAFYVTCCADSRDKFYDDHCWPAGVELRDWIYYNKQ